MVNREDSELDDPVEFQLDELHWCDATLTLVQHPPECS